jgi:hypothetical protein
MMGKIKASSHNISHTISSLMYVVGKIKTVWCSSKLDELEIFVEPIELKVLVKLTKLEVLVDLVECDVLMKPTKLRHLQTL